MSKRKTVEQFRAEYEKALLAELEGANPTEEARKLLEGVRRNVVMQALGFSYRFGEVEVDHCNGLRNKAVDTMLSEAKGAAEAWIKAQAGSLPDLNKKDIAALHKEYLERLYYAVREKLRERAEADAAAFANNILQKPDPVAVTQNQGE